MSEQDVVEVRVPERYGVLSSETGERIPGGSIGRITAREAAIYGLTPEAEAPAEDPAELERLQALIEAHGIPTTASTPGGLRRALERAGVDPDADPAGDGTGDDGGTGDDQDPEDEDLA